MEFWQLLLAAVGLAAAYLVIGGDQPSEPDQDDAPAQTDQDDSDLPTIPAEIEPIPTITHPRYTIPLQQTLENATPQAQLLTVTSSAAQQDLQEFDVTIDLTNFPGPGTVNLNWYAIKLAPKISTSGLRLSLTADGGALINNALFSAPSATSTISASLGQSTVVTFTFDPANPKDGLFAVYFSGTISVSGNDVSYQSVAILAPEIAGTDA